MKRARSVLFLALALTLALSGVAMAASVEPSAAFRLPWLESGFADCDAVACCEGNEGGFFFIGQPATLTDLGVTVAFNSDWTSFDWISDDYLIMCVIVRSLDLTEEGYLTHAYAYGGSYGDTGLVAPAGGQIKSVTFCKGEEPPEEKEFYGETAWAANGNVPLELRYVARGNWATYVAYSGEPKTLFAGQTIPVGTVLLSAAPGPYVTITINLTGDWVFEDVGENLKVQDYAEAPSGNPAPGKFAWKTTESGQSASITVPANNFYGVHANVGEWRAP